MVVFRNTQVIHALRYHRIIIIIGRGVSRIVLVAIRIMGMGMNISEINIIACTTCCCGITSKWIYHQVFCATRTIFIGSKNIKIISGACCQASGNKTCSGIIGNNFPRCRRMPGVTSSRASSRSLKPASRPNPQSAAGGSAQSPRHA